jgi:2-oxo-3-hexenedioate decarboxylase
MESKINHHQLALEMKSIQDRCGQIVPITSRLKDFCNADAYAVAHMVHDMRLREGAVPIGRKIGFTNPEMWSIYGVREPIWAYVYDHTVKQLEKAQADHHVQCHIGQFAEPKIEPEIVVHFGSPPLPSADLSEVLASIDWIAHGIEVVQSHFPGWKFQAADTIADWGLHATLIVGEPLDVAQLGTGVIFDLENFTVTLSCDDEVREQGKGSNALGSPLKAVEHLMEVLAKQPHASPLQSGEIVTTGTLTAALPIRAGQTWRTKIDGIALSGITISFEE